MKEHYLCSPLEERTTKFLFEFKIERVEEEEEDDGTRASTAHGGCAHRAPRQRGVPRGDQSFSRPLAFNYLHPVLHKLKLSYICGDFIYVPEVVQHQNLSSAQSSQQDGFFKLARWCHNFQSHMKSHYQWNRG
jgi:hypothetical protein